MVLLWRGSPEDPDDVSRSAEVWGRLGGEMVNFLDCRPLALEEDCSILRARGDEGWGRPGWTSWLLTTRSADGSVPYILF